MWQKDCFKGSMCLLCIMYLLLWSPRPVLAVPGPQIQEFPGPKKATPPLGIVAGSDGSIWFSEDNVVTVGRYNSKNGSFQNYEISCSKFCPTQLAVDTNNDLWVSAGPGYFDRFSVQTGARTEYSDPVSTSNNLYEEGMSYPITHGPDGAIWYVTPATIGRITDTGETADFALPQEDTQGVINALTAGPDGNIWFSINTGAIGNITPSGNITSFSTVPAGSTAHSRPTNLIAGPDGAFWFLDTLRNQIGRMTLQGALTDYPLPPHMSVSDLQSMIAGPDGALWFLDSAGNRLLSMSLQGSFSAYPIPTQNSLPGALTAGPNGVLWFSETGANQIGRFTPSGVAGAHKNAAQGTFQAIPVPGQKTHPWFILPGPAGDIWFSEYDTNEIGRITTDGQLLQEYATAPAYKYLDGELGDMARGRDGNLWFGENTSIGRITPSGQLSMFATPSASNLESLTVTRDGNLWFLFYNAHPGAKGVQIGKVTPQGKITSFGFPTDSSAYATGGNVRALVAGPDGNLWITEYSGNKIGRITPQGKMTEFAIPSAPVMRYGDDQVASSFPSLMTSGSDGNLWFLETNGNKLGRITPAGMISEFPVSVALDIVSGMAFGRDGNLWLAAQDNIIRLTQHGVATVYPMAANSFIQHITSGPDGNLWFTEYGADKIGRILLR